MRANRAKELAAIPRKQRQTRNKMRGLDGGGEPTTKRNIWHDEMDEYTLWGWHCAASKWDTSWLTEQVEEEAEEVVASMRSQLPPALLNSPAEEEE
uniref:Uncharacterized protein n=1 Tax=Globodera rostochiensis TaxID=31243 RepID=A0A914GZS3_GLORO